MNWANLGTITKKFSTSSNYGPFTLPKNIAYTGLKVSVDSAETLPLTGTITVTVSFDGGATWNNLINYSFNWALATNPKGGIAPLTMGCSNDLPALYKDTLVKGSVTLSRSARLTFTFDSGS